MSPIRHRRPPPAPVSSQLIGGMPTCIYMVGDLGVQEFDDTHVFRLSCNFISCVVIPLVHIIDAFENMEIFMTVSFTPPTALCIQGSKLFGQSLREFVLSQWCPQTPRWNFFLSLS